MWDRDVRGNGGGRGSRQTTLGQEGHANEPEHDWTSRWARVIALQIQLAIQSLLLSNSIRLTSRRGPTSSREMPPGSDGGIAGSSSKP
jgi:hypothetical protein